ncbi:hypothetical protein [Haloplanus pelagicus]|uniref:hypothetical protein n=1 Tax=Haloplanus pelagicus TaxID=2949995 RepID=UPI00204090FC|nr:hypothetical protein [Haloplanus sp. HW8-1]
MSRDLLPSDQFGRRVSTVRIDEGEINSDRELQAGQEITIWSTQVPADKAYVWGAGPDDRNAGNANYVYAMFKATGNGSGGFADGDVIEDADVVLAITDSTQEDVIAKTTINPDAGDLDDAVNDDRTDRPVLPEHAPGATEDKHLELRLRARSDADGARVGTDSNVHLGYGQVG